MKLGEFEIETDELVYVPSDDTFLLAENLDINYGDSVLEIGTGTGLVAMHASKLTDKVIATDINFNALELAESSQFQCRLILSDDDNTSQKILLQLG